MSDSILNKNKGVIVHTFKLVNMYQNRDTSKERLEIINKPVTEVNKQSSVSTISSIIEEVKSSICDNYCRYSSEYEDYDRMLEEVCSSCPLNRL